MNNLDNLIAEFQATGDDLAFEAIYAEVTQATIGNADGNLYFEKVARSLNSDMHSAKASFDDTLLSTLRNYQIGEDFLRYFKSSWKRRRSNVYGTATKRKEREGGDHETTLLMIPADQTEPFAIKEADQRKLIDHLLSDADTTTTAIVEAFLNHPKPTATAIARDMGVHHSKIIRKLERLAGKFDSKQYGSHRDYLVAGA